MYTIHVKYVGPTNTTGSMFVARMGNKSLSVGYYGFDANTLNSEKPEIVARKLVEREGLSGKLVERKARNGYGFYLFPKTA